MAITVAQCLSLPSLVGAEVVAGRQGLGNPVRGISVLESAKVSQYLTADIVLGDELVITGFISDSMDVESQCEVVRILHAGGEAGLILFYVGIFMPEVPRPLIELANELGFPVIRMPSRADIPYSEVIRDVMELIFKRKLRSNAWTGDPKGELEAELVQVLLDGDKLGMMRLERRMGPASLQIGEMRVIMLPDDEIRGDNGKEWLKAVRAHCQAAGVGACVALYGGALVALLPKSARKLRPDFDEMLLRKLGQPFLVARIGQIGDNRETADLFALARRTLQQAARVFPRKRLFSRQDLAFVDNSLRILASDDETGRHYPLLLERIRQYDRRHGGKLLPTLECYLLDANLSTATAAEQLFLHRHTIQYRLDKLKQYLGLDVYHISSQFELALACAIRRLTEDEGTEQ